MQTLTFNLILFPIFSQRSGNNASEYNTTQERKNSQQSSAVSSIKNESLSAGTNTSVDHPFVSVFIRNSCNAGQCIRLKFKLYYLGLERRS